jgi:16S rRNA (adenine1518-N6/adenine1519-N6)-dimethyltransferase
MQTKRQIQQLLTSAGITANKRFGQNFLIDLNLMRLLVDSANISSSDIVLEVGCGTGSLTEAIAPLAGKTIAVEIDSKLAKIAKRQLASAKNVTILNTDILENKNTLSQTVIESLQTALALPKHYAKTSRKKQSGRFLLVANLPYNVASAVMINLVMGPITGPPLCGNIDAMYVTVQKEVADRMTAKPGSSNYGTLSIFLSAAGDIKTIRTLKPTVFWPQPQVASAMVSFVRKEEKANRIKNFKLFSEVVNLFMQHRRKMLKACSKFATGPLGKINNWPEIFEQCSLDPRQRPQQLSPESYIAITNLCCEHPTLRS